MFPSLILLAGGLLLRLVLWHGAPSGTPLAAPLLWGLLADLGFALLLALPLTSRPTRRAGSFERRTRWDGGWRAGLLLALRTLLWALWLAWLLGQYFYFSEFGTRPDQIVLDYLFYTGEVTGNVWESYPTGWLAAGAALLALALAALERAAARPRRRALFGPKVGRFLWLLIACGLIAASIGVEPPMVTGDRIARELARNGAASLAEAALTGELDYRAHYTSLPSARADALVERWMADAPGDRGSVGPASPVMRRIEPPPRPEREGEAVKARALRPNVILIVAESLGTELTARGRASGTGRPSLTPAFDKLSERGLLFTRLYATGTRTARALEGALASFPPIPGNAIVRLASQRPVTTLATVLGARGYESVFLYGGSLGFDNMRDFLKASGFTRLEEQVGAKAPGTFATSWGAADEFLFDRLLDELRHARSREKPLFLTALTVSNHRPFLFPEGRVGGRQRTREGAVAYADYALGRLFEAAEREGLLEETLFAIIGDHGPRSYTRDSLPTDAHRVPFLLLGAGIERGESPVIGSTIDVAPTLLARLGEPYVAPFFGRDLGQLSGGGAALIQDKHDVGLILPEGLVALGFNRGDYFAPLDAHDVRGAALPAAPGDKRVEQAAALMQVAYDAWMAGLLNPARAGPPREDLLELAPR